MLEKCDGVIDNFMPRANASFLFCCSWIYWKTLIDKSITRNLFQYFLSRKCGLLLPSFTDSLILMILIQWIFCMRCECESQYWAGIILTRMPTILRLQNFSRKLHILIASYPTRRRKGNMTVQGLRCFSPFILYFFLRSFVLSVLVCLHNCMCENVGGKE